MAVAEQSEAAVTNALDASEDGSETRRYATVLLEKWFPLQGERGRSS